MAKDTVTIGCKLPAGLVLEIGYQTVEKIDGRTVAAYKRLENYDRQVIRGWNHHSFPMRQQLLKAGSGMGVPHGMNTSPYLNRDIPKAFWEEWKRTHASSWLLKNELLFEVATNDPAGAALRVAEGDKTPKVFEPLDRNKTIVPGIKELERDDKDT
jgi:hypothetical protein